MEPSGAKFSQEVADVATAQRIGDEYVIAISKIIASHTMNELYGAQVFDEPAIALAPTPYEKWLTCRIAMEEYGHHVRFRRLADDLGIPEEKLDPAQRHLSIFEYELKGWPEFLALKALADLAEILQMEDLLVCSYIPLRILARELMPEEKFHAGYGRSRLSALAQTEDGKQQAQAAVDNIFPVILPFFGQSRSKNNELFRKWGVKVHSNGAMRGDFISRVQEMTSTLGLEMPAVPQGYVTDLDEFQRRED
ncbi:MAG: phenylacetate-CoA oxygenase subunit PaaI [Acidobacteriales bacterium]|nr:phenylacetate-CoA oxygenase subunit PaaI [Terriglobales bacterium]